MLYKIVVDKQSRVNPSPDKRTYEINIEELRILGDVYDSLVITKDETYVMRKLVLSEFHVLSVLPEPIKQPLTEVNIQLFEGDNYIYLIDMEGNRFYAEYLIKNEFNDLYVIQEQMNAAILESASQIEISVNQKLTEYSTTEEMIGAITTKAGEIYIEVNKKVNDEDLTGANIALRINNDTSEAEINANKINLNGAVTANNNFKILTDGSMEAKNGKFDGGSITLYDDQGTSAFRIAPKYGTGHELLLSNEQLMLGAVGTGVWINVDGGVFLDIYDSYNSTEILPSGITTPSLTVTGSKNRAVKINNGEYVLLNAYETATPYFGDIGSNKTDENGYCKIDIEEIFSQTIELEDYKVFIQECGNGQLYVEKHDGYFEVKGTPNLEFDWELKAIQKGYKNTRLEIKEEKQNAKNDI